MIERYAAELVLDARAVVGEAPRWDSRVARLVWVDILGGSVHVFDPVSGADNVHDLGAYVGAAALRRSGDYVVVLPDGVRQWKPRERALPLVMVREGVERRFNDAACDPAGRLLAASLDTTSGGEGSGTLYSITDQATVVQERIGLPNGIDWSPDGRTLYFTDSLQQAISCFDYDIETGAIGDRTDSIAVPEGLPDGHTVDAEGNIWVAQWSAGSVMCLSPAGHPLASVAVPVRAVTACAFGGDDMSVLFITTMQQKTASPEALAGGLFACHVGFTGRAPNAFAW